MDQVKWFLLLVLVVLIALRNLAAPLTIVPITPPALATSVTDCNTTNDDYELALCVHNAISPARAAGQWVYRPDEPQLSPEHLECLDGERQGNCHDQDA